MYPHPRVVQEQSPDITESDGEEDGQSGSESRTSGGTDASGSPIQPRALEEAFNRETGGSPRQGRSCAGACMGASATQQLVTRAAQAAALGVVEARPPGVSL